MFTMSKGDETSRVYTERLPMEIVTCKPEEDECGTACRDDSLVLDGSMS
jgi:hypothetical protein